MKEQKGKLFEEYKKSIEATNALIKKRKLYYNSLLEAMMQLDQSRAGYTKSLLAKYVAIIEKALRIFAERVSSIGVSVSNIKPETDLKSFIGIRENTVQNHLFNPMTCVEYDSEYF